MYRKNTIAVLLLLGTMGCGNVLYKKIEGPNSLECISTQSSFEAIYLGNTTLVFTDSENSIVIDGFVSRPSSGQMLFGFKPNKAEQKIRSVFEKIGFKERGKNCRPKIDAVIPLHNHFDHSMDAPFLAHIFKADLVGSDSFLLQADTVIGKPKDVHYNKLSTSDMLRDGKLTKQYGEGNFELTLEPAVHATLPTKITRLGAGLFAPFKKSTHHQSDTGFLNNITWPWSRHFRANGGWNVLIEHSSRELFYIYGSHTDTNPQSSTAIDFDSSGIAEKYKSITVFMAAASYGNMKEDKIREMAFWDRFKIFSEVKVVPVHWDNFTKPLNEDEELEMSTSSIEALVLSLKAKVKELNKTENQRYLFFIPRKPFISINNPNHWEQD